MQSKSPRGRPKKLGLPPRASTSRTAMYSYVRPDDLATMADATGIPIIADEESQHREVHRINQALNDFVLFENGSDASLAEKRDWCETVAAICRNLIDGLGMGDHGLRPVLTPDGWSRHLDARRHLADGFFLALNDDRNSSMLKALLMSAQFGTGVTKASELNPVEAFDFAMERIGGSLGALAVIADRAAMRFSRQIRRGGKNMDYARRGLFFELGISFECLFGRKVSTWADSETGLPTGPAFEWHRSLLELVAARVRQPIAEDGADTALQIIEQINPPSRVLVELASRAAGKTRQARYHALAHWMRDATDDRRFPGTADES